MVFLRDHCEKCLEHMRVEKVGDDYIMVCPKCQNPPEEDEYSYKV